jgi:2-polyprenyl-3-methyl-5-hydroxy-6-metoxy-1,4-benzoquinol methylase
MNHAGVLTVETPPTADAGAGRAVWLAAKVRPGDTVLDCGGTGSMLVPWHPAELVTAIDDLSGFGKGHRLHAGTFHRGDVCDLSRFSDQSFDVAVLAEVLEHVGEPWRALREAGRVAKRVLITTPNEMRWRNGIAFKVAGHIRFITADLLALHLRMAGLDGEIALLEFASWAFWVAEVKRRGD